LLNILVFAKWSVNFANEAGDISLKGGGVVRRREAARCAEEK
jgi:hypothetical protein